MKKTLVAFVLLTVASTAAAQSMITRTPRRNVYSPNDGFRIGPRISNYATNVDVEIITLDSGRQVSFGLVGDFKSGPFVLDFNYDHDPENGINFTDILPIDFGRYERDRGEVTIGWAAIPYLDLQGGIRFDSVSLGASFFADELFGESYDYQALVGGIKVHTATYRPYGVYGLIRGYTGTVDFGDTGFGSAQLDMTGFRAEGGVVISIGDSNWSVVPGIEYEWLESEGNLISMETNRLFANVVYQFPR